MKIAIAKVNIGDRQRRDLGDIDGLAASLARFDLLHPIVLDENYNLIAGHRRLTAAMHLGWEEIEYTLRSQLDEVGRKELELEENIKRKDLNWPEEVRAVRDLFRLRQAKYGGAERSSRGGGLVDQVLDDKTYYSLEDLSEELDKAKGGVHFSIKLADALDELPEIEREATKKAAWTRYMSWREMKLREEIAKRGAAAIAAKEAAEGGPDIRETEPEARAGDIGTVRQPIRKATWKGKGILYHADCRDVLRILPAESVDAIVTDPPFGLGMHTAGSGVAGKRLAESQGHMYDDDPHMIMDMLDEAFGYAARVLKPDGHMYCFFHMTRYEVVYVMLRKHFGSCNPVPIVWIKNTPGIGDPNKDWVYAYEPCFFLSRGDRSLVKPQAFNWIKYDTIPPSQKIHPTQKPAALLRHIIQASCVNGEVVLDPFSGSGSTLVGAHQSGCRFIGIEREEPFYRAACENIAEALAQGESETDNGAREAALNLTDGSNGTD